jgi:vancomycin permeability regulator SanA
VIRFGLIGLVCAIGLYLLAFLVFALIPRAGRADLVVVPGNSVLANGQPSRRLAARLDAAVQAYEQGLAPLILVSGGTGATGFDEALAMRDYLRAAGIPAASIRVDSAGVNTMATATNAVRLMRQENLHTVLLATQYFHIPRGIVAFRRAGAGTVLATYPRFLEGRDLYSVARELMALPVYYFGHPGLPA